MTHKKFVQVCEMARRESQRLLWNFLPSCIQCGDPSTKFLCPTCFEKLRFQGACLECGKPCSSSVCLICQKIKKPWKSLSAGFLYEGGIKDWIIDIKWHRHPERFRELKLKDLRFLFDLSAEAVLPVTSDPMAVRRRLFDPAESLASHISKLLSIPLLKTPFVRMPFLDSQKNLEAPLRQHILKKTIRLDKDHLPQEKRILLVDDVMATGSSLRIHADLLASHGVEVHVFALARVMAQA